MTGPLEDFILDVAQDCVDGQQGPMRWSWERMVGARHCPECHSEGCDACQMTGWAGGREP